MMKFKQINDFLHLSALNQNLELLLVHPLIFYFKIANQKRQRKRLELFSNRNQVHPAFDPNQVHPAQVPPASDPNPVLPVMLFQPSLNLTRICLLLRQKLRPHFKILTPISRSMTQNFSTQTRCTPISTTWIRLRPIQTKPIPMLMWIPAMWIRIPLWLIRNRL
jgi:hypothetical protein